MIPDQEFHLLLNTVESAARYAAAGQLVDGHAELLYGLRRAQTLHTHGSDWADTLAARYRMAVDGYCERFGVRLD
jgi:hypothetical protein